MIAMLAAFAIVVRDHALLRAEPSSTSAELLALGQGEVLEVRGERAGYLQVYNYHHERGGYLRADLARPIGSSPADAPELLAVMRFLRDTPGSEALGISYGAAYLKAVPAGSLAAEAFDAIATMAERLADSAADAGSAAVAGARIEVVQQFGIRMRSFESRGQVRLCYDGELFRRVLAINGGSAAERARAALGLTRPDCIDPELGPVLRANLDEERGALLDRADERGLSPMLLGRLQVRRAATWASIAFARARRGQPALAAAQRAYSELLSVHPEHLGEDRRSEYLDALIRVSAIRWAAVAPVPQTGPLILAASPGEPGQTCLSLEEHRARTATLMRRCTYGIPWLSSLRPVAQGTALVLAVQPLDGWRELWIFHQKAGEWVADIVSPGIESPEAGYVEFAGFAPATRRVLIAREVRQGGRFRRYFEELRLDDLVLVRQASAPDLLRDFGRWQDAEWRRDSLSLH